MLGIQSDCIAHGKKKDDRKSEIDCKLSVKNKQKFAKRDKRVFFFTHMLKVDSLSIETDTNTLIKYLLRPPL